MLPLYQRGPMTDIAVPNNAVPSTGGGAHGPRVIDIIADYIVTAALRPTTGKAREAAVRCILDLLGAAAAGIEDPGARVVRSVARGAMGSRDFPIWFTGENASLLGSAWANSSAASALDLDDGHRPARHPGAAVIPTPLTVAI